MPKLVVRDLLACLGWTVVLDSIFLQALYFQGYLVELDLVLLFLGSTVAGAIIVDVERLVLVFVGTMVLSTAVMFFCLNLPVMLSLAVASGASQDAAIVMIFRSIFPISVFFILFGGFFGTFVGERLNLR